MIATCVAKLEETLQIAGAVYDAKDEYFGGIESVEELLRTNWAWSATRPS